MAILEHVFDDGQQKERLVEGDALDSRPVDGRPLIEQPVGQDRLGELQPEDWTVGRWTMPPAPTVQAARSVRPNGVAALELELATHGPEVLDDHDLIEAIRGFEQVVAWAGARQAGLLAEFARRRPAHPADRADSTDVAGVGRYAPDEVGLALTLSRGTAGERLARAVRLREVLPATLAAWDSGLLDAAKVRAIHDATLYLSDGAARAIQERVLPRAPRQTLAQLRSALARAVIAVDPHAANERHRAARQRRRVTISPEQDGMASLWAFLTAPDALTAYGWLTALARGLGTDDPRCMDARRADLLVALLTGRLVIHPEQDTRPDADCVDTGHADSMLGATAPTGVAPTDNALAETECGKPGPPPTAPAGPAPAWSTSAGLASARSKAAGLASAGLAPVSGAAHASAAPEAPAQGATTTKAEAATGARRPATAPATTSLRNPSPADPGRLPPRPSERLPSSQPVPSPGGAPGQGGQADLPVPVAPGKPLVHVVVPFSTLIGMDHQPVELAGYGPIPADLAREVAVDSVWQRLVVDPMSGALLDHGRTTYRPPAALADYVRARDVTCRVPICRRRVLDCDLDHAIAFNTDHGSTDEENLYGGCRHHHRMKDEPGWSVTQHPDGRVTWNTPTGHRYTSQPYDYRSEPDLAEVAALFGQAARDDAVRRAAAAPKIRIKSPPPEWTEPGREPDPDDPAPF